MRTFVQVSVGFAAGARKPGAHAARLPAAAEPDAILRREGISSSWFSAHHRLTLQPMRGLRITEALLLEEVVAVRTVVAEI
jgi:hypothetical protein